MGMNFKKFLRSKVSWDDPECPPIQKNEVYQVKQIAAC
jgi:hypothetical protein